MLLLAWLLSLFCVVGCYRDETKYYGKTFKMRLHVRAKMVDFTPANGGYQTVLWKDDGTFKDTRRKVVGNYFTVYDLTQLDNGQYSMKDKNGFQLSSTYLEVIENVKSYAQKSGERFEVSYDLPADSCFIYFRPDGNDHYTDHNIVTRGMIDRDWYRQPCSGLELLPPCGLVNEDLHASCAGTFTFKDGDSNPALQADLTVESSVDYVKIIASSVAASVLVSCCCCVKRCCCKKSKKDEAETPGSEAAVNLQEYENEPAVPRSYQHDSVPLYPALPSPAPAAAGPSQPLVHPSPPAMPPAYSEASVPADTSYGPTVTFPLDSGPEPRFELKGLTFDSPLNPNSSQSDVYTSDKLNFL